MTTRLVGGPSWKEASRDKDGHRTYKATWQIEGDCDVRNAADGPTNVFLTPGLPTVGTPWIVDGDVDIWAWCTPESAIRPASPLANPAEPIKFWSYEATFTTRPVERDHRNNPSGNQENPVSEPDIVSGSFIRYTEEGQFDRFGQRIQSSSMEPLRGPQNEWEEFRAVIHVQQQRPLLGIDLWFPMINTLNDAPLWGFPARCWRFVPQPWTQKFHGQITYFQRNFDFEVWVEKKTRLNGSTYFVTKWDRELIDIGTRVLRGKWVNGEWVLSKINGQNPNPTNPLHFQRYQDANGNLTTTLLDGAGKPLIVDLPTTSDCAACNPSPLAWKLTGFIEDMDGNSLSQYNGMQLDHTTGCNWSFGVGGGGPIAALLTYDAANGGVLTVSAPTIFGGTGNWIFRLSPGIWSCLGVNTLVGDFGNPGEAPGRMTVFPVGGDDPFKIRVSKYQESNFLLLGLPPVIGP